MSIFEVVTDTKGNTYGTKYLLSGISLLLSDVRPRSAPALELLSRTESSVGVCSVPAVPTQGEIPDKGGY